MGAREWPVAGHAFLLVYGEDVTSCIVIGYISLYESTGLFTRRVDVCEVHPWARLSKCENLLSRCAVCVVVLLLAGGGVLN